MNDKNIDTELLYKLSMEITDRFKLMGKAIPEESHFLLKHIAACAIHVGFFAKEVHNYINNENLEIGKDLENEFYSKCGCDFPTGKH